MRGQLFDRAKGRIGSQLFAGEAHEAVRFGIAIAMKNLILARNVLLENHVRTPRKFRRPTKGEQFLRTLHDKALLEPLFSSSPSAPSRRLSRTSANPAHGEVLRFAETDPMQLLSTFFPSRGHAQSLLANHLILAPIPV